MKTSLLLLCNIFAIIAINYSQIKHPLYDFNMVLNTPENIVKNNVFKCIRHCESEKYIEEYDNNGVISYIYDGVNKKTFNFYDSDNKIRKKYSFYESSFASRFSYKYENYNLIQIEREYLLALFDGVDTETISNFYEGNNLVRTEIATQEKGNQISYFNYKNGALDYSETRNISLNKIITQNYYSNNLISKSIKRLAPFYVKEQINEFKHNNAGLPIEKLIKDKNGKILEKHKIEYKDGLITKYSVDKGGYVYNYKYSYSYRKPNTILKLKSFPNNYTIQISNTYLGTDSKSFTIDSDKGSEFEYFVPETDFYTIYIGGNQNGVNEGYGPINVILSPEENITIKLTENGVKCSGKNNALLGEIKDKLSEIGYKNEIECQNYLNSMIQSHPDFIGHLYFLTKFRLESNTKIYNKLYYSLDKIYPNNYKVIELYNLINQ